MLSTQDMTAIVGRVLSHDDDIPHGVLMDKFVRTKALYEACFGELYNPPLTQQVGSCVHFA